LNNPRIDPVPVVETQRQKRASDDAWESKLLSVRAVLLGTVLLGIAVCSGGWFFFLGETESEDHARMLALLRDIERRTPQENPVMGDVEIKKASLKLASLPSEGYLLDQFKLNWTLGKQHLALGQTDAALACMEAANKVLPGARQDQLIDAEMEDAFLFSLATSYIRAGETKNCVHCSNGDRCIFPIIDKGIHEDGSFSEKAIEYLELLLDHNPDHHSARWLLNIAYMTLGKHPQGVPSRFLISTETFQSDSSFPRFVNIARDLNISTFSMCGGSFGANPLRQQIGVGKATVIHRLEVYWPTSQLTQQFEEIGVDQFIEIQEGSTRVRKLAWKTLSFHPQED
jgi:hypothetical protein